jgi:hypothetical protein
MKFSFSEGREVDVKIDPEGLTLNRTGSTSTTWLLHAGIDFCHPFSIPEMDIWDMGAVPLSSVTNHPCSHRRFPCIEAKAGHTYCVRPLHDNCVWVMRVIRLNVTTNVLPAATMEFEWRTKPLEYVKPILSGCANMGKTERCVLPDYNLKPCQLFSFKKGLIAVTNEPPRDLPNFDLVFDTSNGLSCNNRTIGKPGFVGNGGLCDMGSVPLSSVTNAPASGYVPSSKPTQIVDGHTCCVRASDGKTVRKIQVVRFHEIPYAKDKSTLEFEWDPTPLK